MRGCRGYSLLRLPPGLTGMLELPDAGENPRWPSPRLTRIIMRQNTIPIMGLVWLHSKTRSRYTSMIYLLPSPALGIGSLTSQDMRRMLRTSQLLKVKTDAPSDVCMQCHVQCQKLCWTYVYNRALSTMMIMTDCPNIDKFRKECMCRHTHGKVGPSYIHLHRTIDAPDSIRN